MAKKKTGRARVVAKKKAAKPRRPAAKKASSLRVGPELTETETEQYLVSHIEQGYQLETDRSAATRFCAG